MVWALGTFQWQLLLVTYYCSPLYACNIVVLLFLV